MNLLGLGALPIKNYTTNVVPGGTNISLWEAPSLRAGFDHRGHQCNACGMHHCHIQVLPSGPHRGELVDEPEYEGWSGAGWTIGCTDRVAVSWLNTRLDRSCVDVNEFGWLCGWVMECQEKGYITPAQMGGLELRWGDAEAANALLGMIVRREGFGDVLAEGVKRAAETLGGPAKECAIYTQKGASPRGHDHRARWDEMLDTCTGSSGTLETGPVFFGTEFGLPARINPFDPEAVARNVGTMLGRRHFEDSLGICIFTTRTTMERMCRALGAATGWDYTKEEGMRYGRRVAALLRAFNLRCGIGPRARPPRRTGRRCWRPGTGSWATTKPRAAPGRRRCAPWGWSGWCQRSGVPRRPPGGKGPWRASERSPWKRWPGSRALWEAMAAGAACSTKWRARGTRCARCCAR
jgi:aldehyde:ferredoxin oxidoreductase